MEWLPFYPGSPQSAAHGEHGNVMGMVGKVEKQAGIIVALQVCSMWVDSFLQHSTWVQQPQGILSATFLQKRSVFFHGLPLSYSDATGRFIFWRLSECSQFNSDWLGWRHGNGIFSRCKVSTRGIDITIAMEGFESHFVLEYVVDSVSQLSCFVTYGIFLT